MPDEDFTSIEAALQVVEKFASRLTVDDAEGHVRRSVDELCFRDFGRESHAGHVLLDNRHGLVANVCTTAATGTAERDAAQWLLPDLIGSRVMANRYGLRLPSRRRCRGEQRPNRGLSPSK